jgi:hypothetical protein
VLVHVSAVCAPLPLALHVVLAVDNPESMTTRERRDAHAAAEDLARYLVARVSGLRIGVVGRGGGVVCNASADSRAVLRCLARAFDVDGTGPGDSQESVFTAAGVILQRAHRQHPAPDTREVVVLMSADPGEIECQSWLRDAQSLRGRSILVMTLCLGRTCPSPCLEKVAASPRYAFGLGNTSHRYLAFDRIREDIDGFGLRELVLEYPLTEGVAYVPDSLKPLGTSAAGSYDASNHRISWRTKYLPRDGLSVTFDVKPLVAGTVAMGAGATLSAIDIAHVPFDVALVPQDIWVFGLR